MYMKQNIIKKMADNKWGLSGFLGVILFFVMNFCNNYIWETQVYHTERTIRLIYWKEAVALHLPVGNDIGKKDIYINDEEYELLNNVSRFHVTYTDKITQRKELLEAVRNNHWELSGDNTYYKFSQDKKILLLITYKPLKENKDDEIVDIVIKIV